MTETPYQVAEAFSRSSGMIEAVGLRVAEGAVVAHSKRYKRLISGSVQSDPGFRKRRFWGLSVTLAIERVLDCGRVKVSTVLKTTDSP